MPDVALTRKSLLIRLRDIADAEAWEQFVELYSPMLFAFGRRCGLAETEAADLIQEVMGEVVKSIHRFDYDPAIGKFRSWLYRIAKRVIGRMQRKGKKQLPGDRDTDVPGSLENVADGSHTNLERIWDQEYQQQLLRWALERIEHEFRPSTWAAFVGTAIKDEAPGKVAERLEISVGAVYIAKSRVIKRLGEVIRDVDDC
ncbi:MAG: sigma-70 family RNA polymerase sigma factor [Planctomycetota bacterium]